MGLVSLVEIEMAAEAESFFLLSEEFSRPAVELMTDRTVGRRRRRMEKALFHCMAAEAGRALHRSLGHRMIPLFRCCVVAGGTRDFFRMAAVVHAGMTVGGGARYRSCGALLCLCRRGGQQGGGKRDAENDKYQGAPNRTGCQSHCDLKCK